jgi:CubicO group peptidase (beta-lactamase class C family)
MIVALIVASIVLNSGLSSQQGPPDLIAIDRIVREEVDSGFSGVVLVAAGDSTLLLRSYGREAVRPKPTSAFWIGSMTKGFTAAAVLKLEEEGRLSLGDSLERFVPSVPADKRTITIRQLLTHTAGFSASYSGGGIHRRDAAVRAILSQPLAYPPGHGYRYVDDDYELLAAIIELASHQSWDAYVKDRILGPAGLVHTDFWRGDGRDWGHRGANGMSSTAEDLFRWTRVLRQGRVLSPEHRAALAGRQVFVRAEVTDSVYYGYGVRVYARNGRITEVMHSGSTDEGHTGIARALSTGVTVIVLSKAGMHGGVTWSSHVARRLGGTPALN